MNVVTLNYPALILDVFIPNYIHILFVCIDLVH